MSLLLVVALMQAYTWCFDRPCPTASATLTEEALKIESLTIERDGPPLATSTQYWRVRYRVVNKSDKTLAAPKIHANIFDPDGYRVKAIVIDIGKLPAKMKQRGSCLVHLDEKESRLTIKIDHIENRAITGIDEAAPSAWERWLADPNRVPPTRIQ